MTELLEMKEKVITQYGKDSFEAGYIQYIFSKRPTAYLKKICIELLTKKNKK